MRWFVRAVQVLYTASLLVAFGYWWYVWQIHSGMPPQDEALGRWATANPWAFSCSFYPVAAQPTYLLFWWITRRMERAGFWSWMRKFHLALVLLITAVFLVLWISTPDVSGFRN